MVCSDQESDRGLPSAHFRCPSGLGVCRASWGVLGDPGHLFPGGGFAGHISQHTNDVPTSVSCEPGEAVETCVSCGGWGGGSASALCVCWSPLHPSRLGRWAEPQRQDLVPSPPHPGTFPVRPRPAGRPQHLPACLGRFRLRPGREVGAAGGRLLCLQWRPLATWRSGTFSCTCSRAAWPCWLTSSLWRTSAAASSTASSSPPPRGAFSRSRPWPLEGGGVGWGGRGLRAGGGARGQPAAACPSPRKESVQRHVLRLLLHLHHRVAPSKLEALQKALEPTGQVRPHTRLHPRVALPVLARACACACPRAGLPVGVGGCVRTHPHTHVPWASPAEWRGSEGAVFPAWREARAAGPPEA